jgi:serine/threonine protein kinase
VAAAKRFGRYDLLEPIAKGGMAEVFMARAREDVGFERIVAVKRILPNLAADEEFVSMFVDEAKIAVQLSHASIAQIFDLGMVDEHYYIALEYIHGRDLRAITSAEQARGGAVPIDIACFFVMKVAEALDYAHRATGRDGQPLHVIHRDVSPQNVIVSFDGDVKVIDFGLAKAAGRATQTQAGILKGKLAYLSPEQAHGEEIDWRSDIYALGILLFELLTGQRLFLRDNDLDTVLAVRSGEVPDPRTIAGDISDELAQTVLRTLTRDRNKRFQRAQELAEALEAILYTTGRPLSRRIIGEYMADLFPEAFMEEDDVSELLGIELVEDVSVSVAHPRVRDVGLEDETDHDDDDELFDAKEEEDRTGIFNPTHGHEDVGDQTGPNPEPDIVLKEDTARSSLPPPLTDTSETSIPTAPNVPGGLELITTLSLEPETSTDIEAPPPRRHNSSSRVQAAAPERVTVQARVENDEADLITSVGGAALSPVAEGVGEPDAHEVQTVVAQVVDRDTIPAPAPDAPVTTEQMLTSAVQSLAAYPLYDDEEDDGTVVTGFGDEMTKPTDTDPEPKARGGSGRHRR